MMYQGSCHCGNIAYEVDCEIGEVIECNCSICQRRGHLLTFVTRDKLNLKTPEGNLATYSFNAKRINHHFCPTCGCAPFGTGADKSGKEMAAINVRCLEDVDIAALKIRHFDGRSL